MTGLVALAFIRTVSQIGFAFHVYGLILLPTLAFLGVVTFERAIQASIEDIAAAKQINRVRRFYLDQQDWGTRTRRITSRFSPPIHRWSRYRSSQPGLAARCRFSA